MFRFIITAAMLAMPFLLRSGEFSLTLNEEYALVKHGKNSYRFNLHPLPPSKAQLLIRNGKKNETVQAEILTAGPIPESTLPPPYRIMPSMGQVNINVTENSAKRIVLEIEYFLTTWGTNHGTPLMTRKMFGFGRIFGKYTFEKAVPGMKAEISAKCLKRAPFRIEKFTVRFAGKTTHSGPAELKAGETLTLTLNL